MFALAFAAPTRVTGPLSPQEAVRALSAISAQEGAGPLERLMVRCRGAICPLDLLASLVPPGSRALDLGCGRGILLALLALEGRIRQGAGFDPSLRAVSLGRRLLRAVSAATGVELRLERADIAACAVEPLHDVATMVDVMHHLPAQQRRLAMRRAAAALRPGGLLIYKDMARRPRWKQLANRLHDLLLSKQWVREEPLENVVRWAAEEGLALEQRRSVQMLWYSHELCVFRKVSQQRQEAAGTAP